MSMLTLCQSSACPMWDRCYLAAKSNDMFQSYHAPEFGPEGCEHFLPIPGMRG